MKKEVVQVKKNKRKVKEEDLSKEGKKRETLLREKLSGWHRWWAMPITRKAV